MPGRVSPRNSRSTGWFRPPSRDSSRSAVFTVREPGIHCRKKSDPRTRQTLTSLEQARRIAALAREKLAEDVVILDMRPECSFTDYFVIATGRNPRQTAAIWDEVHTRLKQDQRLLPRSVDGMREGAWIVADYLDVVLHVFTPEARRYYRLEDLWSDVPAVDADVAAV
jgi:ribosome-associated protein